MPWMLVSVVVENSSPVDNVINTDAIIRFGPWNEGTYIKFVDGSSIHVTDPMKEIVNVVLSGDLKKKA